MGQMGELYEAFKQSVFQTWDAGWDEGLEESFMLSDIKDYTTEINEGQSMDCVIDTFWDEWRATKQEVLQCE